MPPGSSCTLQCLREFFTTEPSCRDGAVRLYLSFLSKSDKCSQGKETTGASNLRLLSQPVWSKESQETNPGGGNGVCRLLNQNSGFQQH